MAHINIIPDTSFNITMVRGDEEAAVRWVNENPGVWPAGFQVLYKAVGMWADHPQLEGRLHDLGVSPGAAEKAILNLQQCGWTIKYNQTLDEAKELTQNQRASDSETFLAEIW